ncbi:glycosyltransferase, partial [Patescibacteria group bacterium]|nr:glycosyltransferase [Patescibacteria group bacterium]
WSVLAKNLLNCKAIALKDFRDGDIENYIKQYSPDILIFNSIFGDIRIPENIKKIVILQDNFLAMKKVLPGKLRRIASKVIKLGNDFYSQNIIKQESALSDADLIVAVSQNIADWYGVKADIIPIGVDSNLFKPMEKMFLRKKYGIPLNGLVKIYVGSAHSVKGWDILKKEIKSDKDDFYILVFKDEKVREMPFKNIKVFNRVSQQSLSELYNCADVYIGRSRVESLWLTPIEAMFCNVPIDVSNVGIFADWHPENKNPRKEAFKRGLSREEMIIKWEKVISDL